MKANKSLVIILAASFILLTAFVYYLSQVNQGGVMTEEEREFQAVTEQSTSDESDSIEADINETDFEGFDKELLDIETELNSTTEAQTQ